MSENIIMNKDRDLVNKAMQEEGFVYGHSRNDDYGYSGTMPDATIGKKGKMYISFGSKEAEEFYKTI